MNHLERIEWTNLWVENSGKDKPRILCIGDSITNGFKCPLQAKVIDRYYVTAIMTSKAVGNTYFLPEIDLFTSEEDYDYPIIHFNNGLHGGGLSDEEYGRSYREAVDFLRRKYPAARIILGLSTPVTDKEHTKILPGIEKRNDIVREIAAEYGLEYSDLYSVAAAHPEYRDGVGDGYHYNAAGYNAFAEVLAAQILTEKKA